MIVQPGEVEVLGRLYRSLPVPKRDIEALFTKTCRENGFKLAEGRFRLNIRNKLL